MLAFIIQRLFQALMVMLSVAFIAFLLFQYVGDPVTFMLGQEATPEERVRLRSDLGLDKPFVVQFGRFVGNAAQGEFGLSLRQGRKVSSLIKERLPATLELSFAAVVIALVAGIPLGVYTALRRHGFLSQFFQVFSLVGVALPTFLIGILLILVFAVLLGVLPSYGRGDTVSLGWWNTALHTADGWKHLILPAITLSLFQMTLIMRLVRSEMLEVLRSDYIKFARARGLQNRDGLFWSCTEKYACSGNDNYWAATRGDYCVCHHYGNCISVARHGFALYSSGSVCRHSGDGSLSMLDCISLCGD
jgi:peptide/nickel transport system permease protein